jgi:hypothetical protein
VSLRATPPYHHGHGAVSLSRAEHHALDRNVPLRILEHKLMFTRIERDGSPIQVSGYLHCSAPHADAREFMAV